MRPAARRTEPAGPNGPGAAPESARERLAARIEALRAKAAAEGPRDEPEAPSEHPPPNSIGQAEEWLAATLPVKETERWHQRADGRWVSQDGVALAKGTEPW